MLREMFKKTPERNKYAYAYKSPGSPNNSSLVYGDNEYNSFKNNTTMADSFSKNFKGSQNFRKSFTSGERVNSSARDDLRKTMSPKISTRTTRDRESLSNSQRNFNIKTAAPKKRSLSSSLAYNPVKPNKILNNIQNFVDTSPTVRTVLVRRPILLNKKQNIAKRNKSEANTKLHIRDRYPYDEYKIERNPSNNLNNGNDYE